ncbi:zf-HC2 domain-containing protein [Geodermatophilus sp. YIM 151500]|uniref:anti-sigma factor family protein n=1 Tax=Geodermatophilus sp. YIM 151500 TaxID=2984531 RepID=UPI0021E421BE|nr:zf-HC2 domain-containing protein [Geodermatophilus sp. YIM 151500]MCV2487848.1 zf-HC2 domain-containing protein [Geodermatophilus sp. YIM 151500]
MVEQPDRVEPDVDGAWFEVACQEFVELVTDYLEGALPPPVERAVATHLALCDPCVRYLDQIRRTTAALGTLPAPTLAPAVRAELLDVFDRLHPRPGDGRAGSP